MRLLNLALALSLSALFSLAHANVEKVIFIPPPPSPRTPTPKPPRSHFGSLVPHLTPSNPRISTTLDLNNTSSAYTPPTETSHWIALHNLVVGKRYEVRIVWAATSPADFTLEVYTAEDAVVVISELLYGETKEKWEDAPSFDAEAMYLLILAKPDRYNPHPVDVEIILDPYILNVLPESLLHIASVVALVAAAAVWVSGWVYDWLAMTASMDRAVVGRSKKDN